MPRVVRLEEPHPAEPDTPLPPGAPRLLRLDESSVASVQPGMESILTLSSEEISHFFVRLRRDPDSERWEIRLDAALREILERANDFVPSESGGILLDDPRAKLAGVAAAPDVHRRVRPRRRRPPGPARAQRSRHLRPGLPFGAAVPGTNPSRTRIRWPRSPRPAIACSRSWRCRSSCGDSICGVLELTNHKSGDPYSARDKELLRIFAAYMSSSIQNALDAIRNRALARIDDLTGVYNSRYFHLRLRDELLRADRNGTELSVLFVDIDQLKAVNDRFGHLSGSAIIRDAARAMTENAPPGMVLARYGGDEFVAILPGANLAQALQAAETLRGAIETLPGRDPHDSTNEPLPRVTASIGVASYRDHLAPGATARHRENALLRLADGAMYRAKANGRNRCEVAEPED